LRSTLRVFENNWTEHWSYLPFPSDRPGDLPVPRFTLYEYPLEYLPYAVLSQSMPQSRQLTRIPENTVSMQNAKSGGVKDLVEKVENKKAQPNLGYE
jgi:hypothetical protein